MSERAIDRTVTAGLILYTLAVGAALLLAATQVFRSDGSLAPAPDLRAALVAGAVNLTNDDGFYYLKIAQHVARGAGSTFDGVNLTSGYQPLWLLVLVPIFWITSTPDGALIAAVVLQAALMAVAVALIYRLARIDLGRAGAALASLLWVHSQLPYRMPLGGLEYGLDAVMVLAVVGCCRRVLEDGPPRPRAYAMLGALLALAVLARIDNLILYACIVPAIGWRELRRGLTAARARRLVAVGLPAAAVTVLYVAVNVRLFGHALPISGVVKRDWSARLLESDPLFQAHGWLVAKLANVFWHVGNMKPAHVLFLLAGTAGAGTAWLAARVLRRRLPAIWGPLVLFGCLQVLVFVVVYHDGYSFQRWYFVIQPWLGALLLAAIAEVIWRRARGLGRRARRAQSLPALIAAVAILVTVLASARTVRQWRNEARATSTRIPLAVAAQWMRENLPRDATVGAWNAGMIGYLSERRVVNLDGLVNSWGFYLDGRHDLCRYWRGAGVTHLVDIFEIGREVDFINHYYAPGVDLSSCAGRLDRVWVGPPEGPTTKHAIAFRLR